VQKTLICKIADRSKRAIGYQSIDRSFVMDHETVDTLLNKIAAVLEEHTLILVNHRQNIEQIFKEVVLLKERLQKLESSDSDKSVDADFVAGINVRLDAISDSIRAKG
jgi:uncharacterized coiled-coil protein SlyX